MSAKEMFEKLGYKEVNEFNNIIHYEQEIPGKIYQLLGIEFVLNHEHISCFRYVGDRFNYGAFNDLDIETLQAINQQCKELGWFDD